MNEIQVIKDNQRHQRTLEEEEEEGEEEQLQATIITEEM